MGIDCTGEERFWTISSGNVMALEFLDFDNDGLDEMIVGADDASLRVLKGEDGLHELEEKAPFSQLVKISETTFAYCLVNGSFGVYELRKKLWKAPKSKDPVTTMCGCDIDVMGDGNQLLVIGYASGAIEVRKSKMGEVSHKYTDLKDPIAKLMFYDYQMNNKPQVLAVTAKGSVQGFNV